MFRVRESGGPWEGGTARESKNEPEKKRTIRWRRNCLRKRGDLPRGCIERLKSHANLAERGGRMKRRESGVLSLAWIASVLPGARYQRSRNGSNPSSRNLGY